MSKKDFLISFYGTCRIAPKAGDNILSVKQKISKKIGLNTDQMELISDGKTLSNDSLLDGLYEDGKFRFVVSIKKNWKCVKINFNQSKIAVRIQTNENILGLKSKIQQAMGYEIGRQLLYYHGNTVTDNQRIDEIAIYEHSYFDLRLADQIQIFVKSNNGRHFSMDIQNNEMIHNVKLMIEKKENLNSLEQILIFQGQILQNDQTVKGYGIGNHSEIHLVCKLKGIVQLLIKTMTGETMPIEVHSSETVGNMKLIILDKYNLYPEQQKLLLLGSILEDDKRIDEYPIKDGSVLHLIEKLNSGMPIFIEGFDFESIPIMVYKKMKIAVVKEILEGIIGINRNEQKLYFGKTVLKDEQMVEEYDITARAVIDFEPIDFPLAISCNDAILLSLITDRNTIAADIKVKINNDNGIGNGIQRLMRDGNVIDDGMAIDNYANESTICHIACIVKHPVIDE